MERKIFTILQSCRTHAGAGMYLYSTHTASCSVVVGLWTWIHSFRFGLVSNLRGWVFLKKEYKQYKGSLFGHFGWRTGTVWWFLGACMWPSCLYLLHWSVMFLGEIQCTWSFYYRAAREESGSGLFYSSISDYSIRYHSYNTKMYNLFH